MCWTCRRQRRARSGSAATPWTKPPRPRWEMRMDLEIYFLSCDGLLFRCVKHLLHLTRSVRWLVRSTFRFPLCRYLSVSLCLYLCVSGPTQSVHRSQGKICFQKSMTNSFQTSISKVYFPNCIPANLCEFMYVSICKAYFFGKLCWHMSKIVIRWPWRITTTTLSHNIGRGGIGWRGWRRVWMKTASRRRFVTNFNFSETVCY